MTSPQKLSLEQIFLSHNKSLSIKQSCELVLHSLKCIQTLHNYNIIHRDINPKVFVVESQKKLENIKFLDFGFWKYFRNKNRQHIPCKVFKKMIGKNIIFGSVNNLIGYELSRRDDLISLGYMLIYFIKGVLPWESVRVKKLDEKINKILEIKRNINDDRLTDGLPDEIKLFIYYVKKLKFEEEPDYNYLRNILNIVISSKDANKNYYFNISK